MTEPRNLKDDFIFFWGGYFSQWYKSNFIIGPVEYNCAEQYMMSQKALLFGDYDSAVSILQSKSPSEQKALGRKVKNFDVNIWNQNAKLIVYRANLAKFTQNNELTKYILGTGNKWIVEASPEDTIWGIGMAEDDPFILFPDKWKGTNWLGEILMQVRDDINTIEDLVFPDGAM